MKRNTGLCIFALIHAFYIFILTNHKTPVLLLSILLFLVPIAYLKGFTNNTHNSEVDAVSIPSALMAAIIGGVLCFWLSIRTGPILACGLVGLFASFLPDLFKNKKYHELPYATYCGCFVGMSAQSILGDITTVAILAGFSGLLFASTKQSLEGVGGRLGSLSFATVATYMLIHNIK